MNAKAGPQHNKGAHALIGVGAALIGVFLGFVVVSFDNSHTVARAPEAEAASAPAQRCGTNVRTGQTDTTLPMDSACMQACAVQDKTGKKQEGCWCGKELGNAGPGTTCQNIAGNCTASLPACSSIEKPKLPGEEKMPPKGEEKGGGAPMLPMLPMPKGGEPKPPEQPKDEECQKEPKPANCENGVSNSLFDNFKNLFTGDTSGSENVDEAPSVADRLKSIFGIGSTNDSSAASAINNPTEADVTPVTPTGSNASQLTPSGDTQSNGSQSGSSQAPTSEVTGFGSQSSGETTSQGLTARIGQTLSAIGFTLRNMFSSLVF